MTQFKLGDRVVARPNSKIVGETGAGFVTWAGGDSVAVSYQRSEGKFTNWMVSPDEIELVPRAAQLDFKIGDRVVLTEYGAQRYRGEHTSGTVEHILSGTNGNPELMVAFDSGWRIGCWRRDVMHESDLETVAAKIARDEDGLAPRTMADVRRRFDERETLRVKTSDGGSWSSPPSEWGAKADNSLARQNSDLQAANNRLLERARKAEAALADCKRANAALCESNGMLLERLMDRATEQKAA